MKKIVLLIFTLGFLIRLFSVLPANTIVGFDQARDLFTATTIFRDHNIRVIGPTAGNNPNLHHGVLFWYYMVLPLIVSRGSVIAVVIWNCFFNALAIIVLYLLARDLLGSKKAGIIAALLTAVSYQVVQYAGWISNPTVTVLTVPVFFWGLWKYYQGKKWGLPLAFLFMGLSIEFELFFIYLIPVGLILFLILRMKWPDKKTLISSIILFCIATSSMIATEFKFHFAEARSILWEGSFASGGVGGKNPSFLKLFWSFLTRWDSYSLNFSPQFLNIGMVIGLIILFFLVFDFFVNFRKKKDRDRIVFLAIYFLSPALMFLIGTSNEPWFLIGRPKAIILAFTYVLLKVKPKILLVGTLLFIVVANLVALKNVYGRGQTLLEPDASSIVSEQMKVIDYTYQSSNGQKFEINSLTNPLYINTVWAYQYYWYGKGGYGYLPTWAGGDQLYPYNTLAKTNGDEKYLYLLMDATPRIPPQYRLEILGWANKISKLVEEKTFGGIDVQKRILNAKN